MGGKLGLVQFYECAWVSRTNGTGADSLQGAAISRLQAFPLGGRCPSAHTGADKGAMIERSRSSRGDFAACGRRVPLPAAAKEPKRRRGRLRMSAPRSYSPFPGPHLRGFPLEPGQNFPARGNLSECLNFSRATGPWGCKNCRWCGSVSAPEFAEPTLPVRMLSGRPVSGPYGNIKMRRAAARRISA